MKKVVSHVQDSVVRTRKYLTQLPEKVTCKVAIFGGVQRTGYPVPVEIHKEESPKDFFQNAGLSRDMPEKQIKGVIEKVFIGDELTKASNLPSGELRLLLAEPDKQIDGFTLAEQDLTPAQQEQAKETEFARRSERLVAALEQVTRSVYVGSSDGPKALADKIVRLDLGSVERLTLAVALHQAVERRESDTPLWPDELNTIAVGLEELCISAEPGGQTVAKERSNALFKALTQCVDTPSFRRLATAVIHELNPEDAGTGNSSVGHLRRYLQARATIENANGANTEFAEQVSRSSLDALQKKAQKDESPPSKEVLRNHFYWDNGFHSKAEVDHARKAFEKYAQRLHAAGDDIRECLGLPSKGGLLQPVARYGLLGVGHDNVAAIIKGAVKALEPPVPSQAGEPSSSQPGGPLWELGSVLREIVDDRVAQCKEELIESFTLPTVVTPTPELTQSGDEEFEKVLWKSYTVQSLIREMCLQEQVRRMTATIEELKLDELERKDVVTRQVNPDDISKSLGRELQKFFVSSGVGKDYIELQLKHAKKNNVAFGLAEVREEAGKLKKDDPSIDAALQACKPLFDALYAKHASKPARDKESVIEAIEKFFMRNKSLNDADPSTGLIGNFLQVEIANTRGIHLNVGLNVRRLLDIPEELSDKPSADGKPKAKHHTTASEKAFSGFGIDGKLEQQQATVLRFGGAAHGPEFFIGKQAAFSGGVNTPLPLGQHGNSWVSGGLSLVPNYEGRKEDGDGLTFRLDRKHYLVGKDVKNNDEGIQDRFADMVKTILATEKPVNNDSGEHRLDAVIDALGDMLDMDELSIQRSKPSSRSHAGGLDASLGFRMTGPVGRNDAQRLGVVINPLALGVKVMSSSKSLDEEAARFSIKSHSQSDIGHQEELKASASFIGQFFDRRVALRFWELGSGSIETSNSQLTIKARVPKRHGEIVSEKTFLDAEARSIDKIQQLFRGDTDSWKEAELATDINIADFVSTAQGLNKADHRYYLRKRMHPDVARRLDEFASLQKVLPANSARNGELIAETARLVGDHRAWVPAVLSAYQKEGRTREEGVYDGPVVKSKSMERIVSEREVIFMAGGWDKLHKLEQSNDVKARVENLLCNRLPLPSTDPEDEEPARDPALAAKFAGPGEFPAGRISPSPYPSRRQSGGRAGEIELQSTQLPGTPSSAPQPSAATRAATGGASSSTAPTARTPVLPVHDSLKALEARVRQGDAGAMRQLANEALSGPNGPSRASESAGVRLADMMADPTLNPELRRLAETMVCEPRDPSEPIDKHVPIELVYLAAQYETEAGLIARNALQKCFAGTEHKDLHNIDRMFEIQEIKPAADRLGLELDVEYHDAPLVPAAIKRPIIRYENFHFYAEIPCLHEGQPSSLTVDPYINSGVRHKDKDPRMIVFGDAQNDTPNACGALVLRLLRDLASETGRDSERPTSEALRLKVVKHFEDWNSEMHSASDRQLAAIGFRATMLAAWLPGHREQFRSQ